MATMRPWPGIRRGAGGRGPDGARVRERDRGAHEVVGGDGALSRASHEIVECKNELLEVERPGILDVGDEQRACPVLALDVYGDPQPDLVALDAVRLAVDHGVGVVQPGKRVERAEDRPGHDVGEADLVLPGGLPVLVEKATVLLDGPHGHGANRCGGRDGKRGLHVLDEPDRPSADWLEDVPGQDRNGSDRFRARAGRGRGHVATREGRPSLGARLAHGRRRVRSGLVDDHRHGRRLGLRRDAERRIEVRAPARLNALAILAVLIQEIEGKGVVPSEVADELVEQGVRRGRGHFGQSSPARCLWKTLWTGCGFPVELQLRRCVPLVQDRKPAQHLPTDG